MRRKRNINNSTFVSDGFIKKYFGPEIKSILTPSVRTYQNCIVPYVSHPEAEQWLQTCLERDPLRDRIQVFTGLTGSGKTTIIRHVFGLENSSSIPKIFGKTIIIPIDFNRSQRNAQVAILSSLRATIDILCESFSLEYPSETNENFYYYINKVRRDLLCQDPTFTPCTPHSDRIKNLRDTLPNAYASCQFQFVMDQDSCPLDLAVLVVDNVEAFLDPQAKNTASRYLSPIIEALRLAECLQSRNNDTGWSFNLLIACRHHIWRIMKGASDDNSRESVLLQSYVADPPYDLAAPASIPDIIKKREEILSRKARDSQKWNKAQTVVNVILSEVESSLGDFILQLELKDIRKSLATTTDLVLHKNLQKNPSEEISPGAFRIDSPEQFDLSRVNLIRTIGLGNSLYYTNQSSIIPNLLYNEISEGFELYPLLVLKYFLIRCHYSEPVWDNSIHLSDFYSVIFSFGNSTFTSFCTRAVHYLISHRLLLRSADQPQEDVPGLSEAEIKNIESIYVSGSAIVLWNELSKSSALFQLFIDDIWLPEDCDYFKNGGNDIEHCLEYLKTLIQTEEHIYNIIRNTSRHNAYCYIKAFGSEPVCFQLLKGLIISLNNICNISPLDSLTQSRIQKASEALNIAQGIESDLRRCISSRSQLLQELE